MKELFSRQIRTQIFVLTISASLTVIFYLIVTNWNEIWKTIGGFLNILSPFLLGLLLAFVLWRPMILLENLLQKRVFKKIKKPVLRGITISIVFILFITAVFLLGMVVVPQLSASLTTLSKNVPTYYRSVESFVIEIVTDLKLNPDMYSVVMETSNNLLGQLDKIVTNVIPFLIDAGGVLATAVINVIMGMIISVYLLFHKERFSSSLKRIFSAIFPKRIMYTGTVAISIINKVFGSFVTGQFLNALIVGLICFILMTIFGIPYALLISTLMAIFNIIPMIGPFIGMIPSIFLILMEGSFSEAIVFTIMITILQQVDGSVLQPKIVGDSIGLSGFWVLFAILVGGGLFGVIGILLGVPMLSVIFKLAEIMLEKRERKLRTNTGNF